MAGLALRRRRIHEDLASVEQLPLFYVFDEGTTDETIRYGREKTGVLDPADVWSGEFVPMAGFQYAILDESTTVPRGRELSGFAGGSSLRFFLGNDQVESGNVERILPWAGIANRWRSPGIVLECEETSGGRLHTLLWDRGIKKSCLE